MKISLILLIIIANSCDNVDIKLYNYAVEENQKIQKDTIIINMEVLLDINYDTMYVFGTDARRNEIRQLINIPNFKYNLFEKYLSDIVVDEYETLVVFVKENKIVYEDYFYDHNEKYDLLTAAFLLNYPQNIPKSDYFTRYAFSFNKEFYLIKYYEDNKIRYQLYQKGFVE